MKECCWCERKNATVKYGKVGHFIGGPWVGKQAWACVDCYDSFFKGPKTNFRGSDVVAARQERRDFSNKFYGGH